MSLSMKRFVTQAKGLLSAMSRKFDCNPKFYQMVATPPVKSVLKVLEHRLALLVKYETTTLTPVELEKTLSGYNRVFSELLAFCDGAREACDGENIAQCNAFLKAATAHWYAENGRILEQYINSENSLRFLVEIEIDASKQREIAASLRADLRNIKERRMHPGNVAREYPHNTGRCPTCGKLNLYKTGQKSSIRQAAYEDGGEEELRELRSAVLSASRRGGGGTASAGSGPVKSKKRSREYE